MSLEYGKIIKSLRNANNVMQKDLAEFMQIKRSTYNQFEQQYDIIPIKRLNQIANYFNVSIDYLLGLTSVMSYENSGKEIILDVASKRLKEFRKEHKLNQDKLAKILNVSPGVIAHHEAKRTIIGTPFLYDLCKKYNISADYLLGKIDDPNIITNSNSKS